MLKLVQETTSHLSGQMKFKTDNPRHQWRCKADTGKRTYKLHMDGRPGGGSIFFSLASQWSDVEQNNAIQGPATEGPL